MVSHSFPFDVLCCHVPVFMCHPLCFLFSVPCVHVSCFLFPVPMLSAFRFPADHRKYRFSNTIPPMSHNRNCWFLKVTFPDGTTWEKCTFWKWCFRWCDTEEDHFSEKCFFRWRESDGNSLFGKYSFLMVPDSSKPTYLQTYLQKCTFQSSAFSMMRHQKSVVYLMVVILRFWVTFKNA